ncbi:hypothetical protein C2845_PM09G17000 [Panicum miliaceum]|uniref:Uncharacterized protein n=1 Tax=Panicum miliaceum TaxID=4540 RepID=A0A3L6S2F6_PANMI|nr:hypothetical protein C2845_PM09G17000 [Panicum miliaceum]
MAPGPPNRADSQEPAKARTWRGARLGRCCPVPRLARAAEAAKRKELAPVLLANGPPPQPGSATPRCQSAASPTKNGRHRCRPHTHPAWPPAARVAPAPARCQPLASPRRRSADGPSIGGELEHGWDKGALDSSAPDPQELLAAAGELRIRSSLGEEAGAPPPKRGREAACRSSGCTARRSSSTHPRSLRPATRGLAAAARWVRVGARGGGAWAKARDEANARGMEEEEDEVSEIRRRREQGRGSRRGEGPRGWEKAEGAGEGDSAGGRWEKERVGEGGERE